MGGNFTQLFPPKPKLTEKNLPSQAGKVFIVTGGNAGVGFELAKILYSKGGTVYLAGRSEEKVTSAINEIKETHKSTKSIGQLKSFIVDLADLNSVPVSVSSFLAHETRLDVLFNNAGIAQVPAGSFSAQNYEAHLGTNCLGPFLLTKLLLPLMVQTARQSPKDTVRIVWTSSSIVELVKVPGGLSIAELGQGKYNKDKAYNYSVSKAGNWLLASEFAKRHCQAEGIVSVTQNPGNLRTKSWDGVPLIKFMASPMLHDPIFGAYTEMWCGVSDEVKLEDGGKFAIPWGRWHASPRKDVLESLKSIEDGGTGVAASFYDWCEKETASYMKI